MRGTILREQGSNTVEMDLQIEDVTIGCEMRITISSNNQRRIAP